MMSTMNDTTYRTYAEWRTLGRKIIPGEHARLYAVNPDTKETVPVFGEDQTAGTHYKIPVSTEGWDLVDPETARRNRQPRRRVKPTVYFNATHGNAWVGDDPELNRAFAAVGWQWARGIWRWVYDPGIAGAAPPATVLQALRATRQYLIVEED